MKIKNKSLAAELGLLSITVIWGSAFVVVKNTTASVPTSYMIAIRFALASILMLIIFFKRIKKMDLRTVKNGAILAVLLYAAYYVQTVGVEYTTAGNNAFLTAIYVVVVPFLYWAVRNEKPGIYNIVSAFVCIAGIGLLSLHNGFSMNIGDTLSLLSGFAFAAQMVGISILTEKSDPILLSFTQFVFTAAISLTVALCTEQFPVTFAAGTVWSLLYIGIFSTLIALLMQTVCQKYVPPAKASLIMSLESLFGSLFGILFLNERLTVKTFFGFLLIFSAILLSETRFSFLKVKAKTQLAEVQQEQNSSNITL